MRIKYEKPEYREPLSGEVFLYGTERDPFLRLSDGLIAHLFSNSSRAVICAVDLKTGFIRYFTEADKEHIEARPGSIITIK